MLRAGKLETGARADWLGLVAACKQVRGRKSLHLSEEFVVKYGEGDQTNQVTVPAGTEVVFFSLYADQRLYRTEGVFYCPDGMIISILGYGERANVKDKARARERVAKSVQVTPAPTRNTLDATPWPTMSQSVLL